MLINRIDELSRMVKISKIGANPNVFNAKAEGLPFSSLRDLLEYDKNLETNNANRLELVSITNI